MEEENSLEQNEQCSFNSTNKSIKNSYNNKKPYGEQ